MTFGNALASFTNGAAGVINGEVNISTAAFFNAGEINLATRSTGSTIFGAADAAFTFDNSGSIEMAVNGARLSSALAELETGFAAAIRLRSAINTTEAADVTIRNSGAIVGGLDVKMAADSFVFENTGSIEGIDVPDGYFTPGLVLGVGELSLVQGVDPSTHFDAASASIINAAGASIDHGIEAYLSAFTVNVENHGFIASSDAEPTALHLEQYLDDDSSDPTSFSFVNSGDFEGNVTLLLETTSVVVNNSGTITAAGYVPSSSTFQNFLGGGTVALVIANEPNNDHTISFTNSGTISNTTKAGIGVLISSDNNGPLEVDGEIVNPSAVVNVTNSGVISSTGGATLITAQQVPFLAPGQVLVAPGAGLVVDASDVAGSVVNIENTVGGLIEAGGLPVFVTPTGFNAIPNAPPGALTVALFAAGETVNIVNSGRIRGGAGTPIGPNVVIDVELRDAFLAGAIQTAGDEQMIGDAEVYVPSTDALTNTQTGEIIGSIDLGGGDDTIINRGTITGAVYLRDGNDALSNFGTLTGDLFFGAGNDTFTQGIAAEFDGLADGEAGEDTFILDLSGGGTIDASIYDRLVNFELFSLVGEGDVDLTLGDEDDVFENGGVLDGEVDLGSGNNTFANTGTITGGFVSGDGDDAITNDGSIEGDASLGDGTNEFVNAGSIGGSVTGGNGSDAVTNGGTIGGDVDLGTGSNTFGNTGTVMGNLVSGNNDDQVTNAGTIEGDVILDLGSTEEVATVAFARSLSAIVGSPPAGGDDTFSNTGRVSGNVSTGAGSDEVSNTGTIEGSVDLGDDDDILNLSDSWVFGGPVSGGAGSDTLNLVMGSSQSLNLADLSSFETLQLTGSLGIISGTASYDQINVVEGRLIGSQGSQINGNVAVSSGGTFGSAGTVTGNISVASGGTLSPGASPAIMNVVGNVSLAAGSTTVFEFVPAPDQSDQLIIDGNLTIASGAVINLVGNRPRTPGVVYDLVIADSITGQFTIGTWDRQAIQGFLRYLDGSTDDRLQLLGTFVFQGDASPQADLAIDYVNGLLASGTASTALLSSIGDLIEDTGFASTAAFSRLTPEAYASATQLAVESGLSLAKVSRNGFAEGLGDTARLYGFGSVHGSWRSLDADAGLGTSQSRNRDYGVIGGIGFGSANASVGMFTGYVESRQRIAALDAETQTDGVVAGLAGHLQSGGFDLNAMVAYSWSNAQTDRALPGGDTGSSGYDLDNLVLDAGATYAVDLGGFTLRPGVGVTHVSARRGGTSESGSAAFGLAVDGDRHNATFVDASIMVSAPSDAKVRPWAQVGLREQVAGERVAASASLLGSAARLIAPGAPRESSVVTASAGLEASVAKNVMMTVNYNGDFGGGTGTTASVGIRARF